MLYACYCLLAILYVVSIILSQKVRYREIIFSSILFSMSSVIGVMIDSHLVGMAGMLYFIVPLTVLIVPFCGLVALFIKGRGSQKSFV